jgi:outer membrane protein TolC
MRCLLLLAAVPVLSAQTAPEPLTFSAAVRKAAANYASVRVSQEQLAAARAGINLARTAYLPRIDGLAQLNRATHNNIYGLLLPQSIIPPISGPVLPSVASNVWGTAIGVLVSWEPFDFGLRKANVEVSEAGRKRAEAAVARTQFEVASLAADAWLTTLAAQQTVRAAQAAVERSETVEKAIGAVVKAELRPGADLSRSQAETALARTQLAQARQAEGVARATLAQMVGAQGPVNLEIAPGRMTASPELQAAPDVPAAHPRLVEQAAAMDEVKARETALDATWRPRFYLQGSGYGRGSGARLDNTSGGAGSGLYPDTGNWAIGFTVMFPIMDFASIRARKEIEAGNERAETARLEQVRVELRGELDRAKAMVEGARAIAQNTPVQLEAARESERQAVARYKAGLSTAIEVAEAERLLTQTEIDDALARLNIWRALLAAGAAAGDLEPLLRLSER